MSLRPLLLFAFGFLLLGADLRADVTIEQVVANPKLWPREVKLTKSTPIQYFENGRPSGATQGSVGLVVRVTRVDATRLLIQIGNATAAVASERDGSSYACLGARRRATPGTVPAPGGPAASAATTNTAAASPQHFDSFRTGWKMPRGKWVVTGDTEIEQHDNKDGVSNAYKSIPQSGKMEYKLKQKYFGGKSACTTIYIMCDDGEKTERGNGYLIADALNEKGHAEITILKVTDDKTKEMKKLASTPVNGQWIDLRITYDSTSGVVEITRNGKVLGSWTDPEPITSGKDFSLGTCMTKAGFKEIEVHPMP